jgi:hypothetical protein
MSNVSFLLYEADFTPLNGRVSLTPKILPFTSSGIILLSDSLNRTVSGGSASFNNLYPNTYSVLVSGLTTETTFSIGVPNDTASYLAGYLKL